MTPSTSLPSTLHNEIAERLAAGNQRYPATRRRLVEILFDAEGPMTVPDLLTALEHEVPVSSVYRNLDHLAEVGVVQRVAGSDDNGRFELAEELSGDHHHHLVCSSCGSITDVSASSRLERALEDAAAVALEENGFEVLDHRTDLVGLCKNCRRGSRKIETR